MDRPRHAGLRHLALNVQRLDEMKTFYVDLLGFAIEWEPDADNIYLSSGIDNLALHRSTALTAGRSAEAPSSNVAPLDHLGLIVRSAHHVGHLAGDLEGHRGVIDAKPEKQPHRARPGLF